MFDARAHYERLYADAPAELEFRGPSLRDGSRREWSAWAGRLRPRLREALGLDAMKRDLAGHAPRAEKSGAEDMGAYVRESWHLWVEPDVPLPFYLLVPKSARGRSPLVLTPHGHNHPWIYVGIAADEVERKSIVEGERDIARGFRAPAAHLRGGGRRGQVQLLRRARRPPLLQGRGLALCARAPRLKGGAGRCGAARGGVDRDGGRR